MYREMRLYIISISESVQLVKGGTSRTSAKFLSVSYSVAGTYTCSSDHIIKVTPYIYSRTRTENIIHV